MKKTIIASLLSLVTLSACHNSDWEFPDYDIQTVYFAYQYPVRTLMLGNDETFDNSLDNQHKCKIMATMGGAYDNTINRIIDIKVANSLCDNLRFTRGADVKPMPANYYKLASNQITIPKGQIMGGVEVELTDAFFADPLSKEITYVIPLVMTDVQNADSILSGTPLVENPNRVVATDWSVVPKDYILYAVKYVNPWDGMYLRHGVDKITEGGETSIVSRHNQFVEDDEVCELTTRALDKAGWNLTVKASGQEKTCDLILTFNDKNKCTVTSATSGCKVSGTGVYVEKGEKNSFNGKDRDAIYLDYTIETGGVRYETSDTLVMRDRQVKAEWFTVENKQ